MAKENKVTGTEIWRRLKWYLIYRGPKRDVTVETLNGLLTFENKDWLIGKYLYVKRSHEAHEIRSVVELLQREGYLDGSRHHRTVLNVGANIGMTAIGLLKTAGFARAIAFEPAPQSYRLLVHNIKQNKLNDRILHFSFALSSLEGEMELELSGNNSGDHRIRRTNDPGFFREEQRKTIKVQVKTLDGLLKEESRLSNERVDLVWVDIEGHEGHFLKGARGFLRQGIPVVSEFWPYGIERSGTSRQDYCQILNELFTDFYVVSTPPSRKNPISEIGALFEIYSKPREMCMIALVSDKSKANIS